MRRLLAISFLLIASSAGNAACLSSYGCNSTGGADLRDQSGRPDLNGNRYESDYLRQQQRDTYDRQQYDRQNRALNNGYDSYGQRRKCGYYDC